MECPECGERLFYVADIGAPGIGQSWQCDNGHEFVKVGNVLSEEPVIMQPWQTQ